MKLRDLQPRPSYLHTAAILVLGLSLFTGSGLFIYREHRKAVNSAVQAEWFSVCQATGWKTDVCKLTCQPADRVPAVEVQP